MKERPPLSPLKGDDQPFEKTSQLRLPPLRGAGRVSLPLGAGGSLNLLYYESFKSISSI